MGWVLYCKHIYIVIGSVCTCHYNKNIQYTYNTYDNIKGGFTGHKTRGLVCDNRSEGCFLSYSNSSRISSVPPFHMEKQSVSILPSSVRTDVVSTGFYRYNTSVDGGMPPPRDQSDFLSRRHSDFSSLKVDSIQTPRYGDGNFEECRVSLQLRKVQAGSIANISVSGVGLGCDTHESISSPGQERSNFSNGIKNDSVSRSQTFGCNDPAGKIKFLRQWQFHWLVFIHVQYKC